MHARSIRGATVLAAAFAVLAVVPGCDRTLFKKWKNTGFDYRTTPNVKLDVRPLESGMDVLRVQGKKDASPSFGVARFNYDLRPPFALQVSVGGLDPTLALPAFPGTGCLELDARDSSPLTYYGMCFQAFAEGAQAFAYKNGSNNLGSVVFYDATALDLRIEADGDDLTFLARRTGDLAWQTVATTPYSFTGTPLIPSIGSNALQAKTGVSFANPVLGGNGVEDIEADAPNLAAMAIDGSLSYYLLACALLKSGEPDIELAESYILSMRQALGTAGGRAAELPVTKDTAKAEKLLISAGLRLDKALEYIDAEMPVEKVLKEVTKAADQAADALPHLRAFKTKL